MENKVVQFELNGDCTVFVYGINRTFRTMRCVYRHFRGAKVRLVPVCRESIYCTK